MTPAQRRDVNEQLPPLPADAQDNFDTKPLTPITDEDAALDADIQDYVAVVKRIIAKVEETDDGL